MDWDRASDQEIYEQLEKAELAHKILTSEEWKLISEVIRRTYEGHVKLLRTADPTNTARMMELQQICNMYSQEFLPKILKDFRDIGDFAAEEAKRRGFWERMFNIGDLQVGRPK